MYVERIFTKTILITIEFNLAKKSCMEINFGGIRIIPLGIDASCEAGAAAATTTALSRWNGNSEM